MKSHRRAQCQAPLKLSSSGFTLPELLVGVVLGAVVLASLGGSVLVSQMRISTKIRTDIERRDALNRAIALMRSEIAAADNIQINKSQISLCPNPNLLLVFASRGSVNICYSVQQLNSVAFFFDQSSISGPWTGPCVLTRTGPFYDDDTGKLSKRSIETIHVILDRMSSCSAVSSSLVITPGQDFAEGKLADVDVELKQISGVNTRFSARVESSLRYPDPSSSSSNQVGPVCFWNGPQSSLPTSCITNIYHFNSLYSRYQHDGNCTYDRCVLLDTTNQSKKTFTKVDVLVFADREIRP